MGKLIRGGSDQRAEWDYVWKRQGFAQRSMDWGRSLYNKAWLGVLQSHLPVGSFAELGCGKASLLADIAPFAKEIVGIDYSEAALRSARAHFKARGITNARFVRDNALGLRTKQKFDVVWSQGLIEHFDEPGRVIREHVRITKKNGVSVMSGPYKYSYQTVWYGVTRPRLLRRFWPWTEQRFLTRAFLEQEMRAWLPGHKKYEITANLVAGFIVLKIWNTAVVPSSVMASKRRRGMRRAKHL